MEACSLAPGQESAKAVKPVLPDSEAPLKEGGRSTAVNILKDCLAPPTAVTAGHDGASYRPRPDTSSGKACHPHHNQHTI